MHGLMIKQAPLSLSLSISIDSFHIPLLHAPQLMSPFLLSLSLLLAPSYTGLWSSCLTWLSMEAFSTGGVLKITSRVQINGVARGCTRRLWRLGLSGTQCSMQERIYASIGWHDMACKRTDQRLMVVHACQIANDMRPLLPMQSNEKQIF